MKKYVALISEAAYEFVPCLEKSFDVMLLPSYPNLSPLVASHPDMLIFGLEDQLIVPQEYIFANEEIFCKLRSRSSVRIIEGSAVLRPDYPFDIPYNVLLCGASAFSLARYTAPEIMSAFEEKGIKNVNVRQGYAACSSLSVGRGLITADPSIATAAAEMGIDVLQISEGFIRLDGYSCGFIGGASAVLDNKVFFFGDPLSHPDGEHIEKFIESRGLVSVALSDGELRDFGGIRFVKLKD